MPKLQLYYRPTCPFCRKVLSFMDEADIELDLVDISDYDKAEELKLVGGKQQVPCLVIDGKAMYESDDIIEWMKQELLA